jgi:hypothetical protein
VTFYLDHNVALELAHHLRDAGHDARTARDLEMERAGDETHLSLAARSGWTLITHNAKDFTLLHAAWRRWSQEWGVTAHHAGILVLTPPVAPTQAAQEVLALLEAGEALEDALYKWRRHSGWMRHA